MTVLACWVLFPLVLAGLALGHGLALERLAGVRLPGALLAPVGLALVVVVTGLLVAVPHAARLAVPLTVAIALGGLFVGRHRLRPHDVSGAALAAAAATYVVFMGPVALSGEPTFAGYFKLDDTASFFALADRAIDHGRDMSGLPESTYRSTLNAFLPGGYPLGSVLPLAVGARLVAQDLAWVYQPWISFLAAMAALSGFSVVRRLVRPWFAAAAAFVASCSALLYGFAMWGGVKEVAHAWLLPALAATVPPLVAPGARPRAVLPMCVVAAALVGTMTVAAAVYVAPVALLVAGVIVARRREAFGGFRLGWRAVAIATGAVVLALPAISTAKRFLDTTGELTTQGNVGQLIAPLKLVQVFGVWPANDFRDARPEAAPLAYLLIAAVALAAAFGVAVAVRRRAWEVLALVAGGVIGSAAFVIRGSPWIDAKALAVLSPAVLLVAGLGLAEAAARWRGMRSAAAVALVAGAVGLGVLAGVALAYHEVYLAPRAQLADLQRFNGLVAGHGPTLVPIYEPYAGRYFLRDGAPEVPSDLPVRPHLLRGGGDLAREEFADLDAVELRRVLEYRSIVLPRGPTSSRPPASFTRVAQGRYYELWQRADGGAPVVVEHLPISGPGGATSADADCARVRAIARRATATGGAQLVAAPAPPVMRLAALGGHYPARWGYSHGRDGLAPWLSGTLTLNETLGAPGDYELWIQGFLAGDLDVSADGHGVGTVTGLARKGMWHLVGRAHLDVGTHVFELHYRRSALSPGTGVPYAEIDTLALRPASDRPPALEKLAPSRWRSLCGRGLDWVEAVRPARAGGA